jgi:hypothetical protein
MLLNTVLKQGEPKCSKFSFHKRQAVILILREFPPQPSVQVHNICLGPIGFPSKPGTCEEVYQFSVLCLCAMPAAYAAHIAS